MPNPPEHDYNAELQRVAALASIAANAAAETGRQVYADELGRLTNAYLLYRYLVERGAINSAPKAIRILYAKLNTSIGGILHLLKDGYAGPAAMVLRGLMETAVHLQVILKQDTAARCQLFEDYLFIQRREQATTVPLTAEQQARNDADYARVRSNYHPTRPYSWCWQAVPSARFRGNVAGNPTFKELCQHIEHSDYYELLYGPLSGAIHPVPSYELWMRRPDGHMELGPNFTAHVRNLADVTIALADDCFVRVVFSLDLPDSLPLSTFAVTILGRSNPS